MNIHPDSKIHGANLRPTWVLSAPDGPHVGPINLAVWVKHMAQSKYFGVTELETFGQY